jgi:hypothetical protein
VILLVSCCNMPPHESSRFHALYFLGKIIFVSFRKSGLFIDYSFVLLAYCIVQCRILCLPFRRFIMLHISIKQNFWISLPSLCLPVHCMDISAFLLARKSATYISMPLNLFVAPCPPTLTLLTNYYTQHNTDS